MLLDSLSIAKFYKIKTTGKRISLTDYTSYNSIKKNLIASLWMSIDIFIIRILLYAFNFPCLIKSFIFYRSICGKRSIFKLIKTQVKRIVWILTTLLTIVTQTLCSPYVYFRMNNKNIYNRKQGAMKQKKKKKNNDIVAYYG